MSRQEMLTVLQTPVTRRTLVASGTKLAYSAPIIAASFHLTELTARAETAVSVSDETDNRGMFPPRIETVAYSAPGWILITGRNLSNAVVKFQTNDGVFKASIDETNMGRIEVNTDDQIIVFVTDRLTILTTTVETPDGIDIYETKVEPESMDEDKSEEEPRTDEQEPAPTEEVPVDEAPAQEPPVQNEPPAEQPTAEPTATKAPVQEPPVEELPVVEEPVEEPPATEQPVQTPTGQ